MKQRDTTLTTGSLRPDFYAQEKWTSYFSHCSLGVWVSDLYSNQYKVQFQSYKTSS